MESVTLKVGDLRRIIAETATEFKPVIGDKVESSNKTEAGKAYKDAKKRANDFDGGGKEGYWKGKSEYKKEDYNGTLLDYNPENMTDDQKKRIHALAKGYNSEAEEKNGVEKSGDYEGNEKIYKEFKKAGQKRHEEEEARKKTGLQASKMPDGTFKKEEMYESVDGFNMRNMINSFKNKSEQINESNSCDDRKVKTVYFKKTQFINEDFMRSRIPDEFKQEGRTFRMKDKVNNEYLLEWKNGTATILEHKNKAGFDESFDRMKFLMGYKSDSSSTNRTIRMNEGDVRFQNMCNKVRHINKGFGMPEGDAAVADIYVYSEPNNAELERVLDELVNNGQIEKYEYGADDSGAYSVFGCYVDNIGAEERPMSGKGLVVKGKFKIANKLKSMGFDVRVN